MENTICMLFTETSRFLKLYETNFLKKMPFWLLVMISKPWALTREATLQNNENLGIGTATWTSLSELEETHNIKPFFNAVRKFYIQTINKMQKFPFGDSLMKNLGMLQPNNAAEYSVSTVISLVQRFPQLGINTAEMLDKLREEFLDFQLSPSPKT